MLIPTEKCTLVELIDKYEGVATLEGKKNKKGTGFNSLTHKLEKEGKSKESAKKIAGSQFWKQIKK